MRQSPSIIPRVDHDIYLVQDNFGRKGRCWRETDVEDTDRGTRHLDPTTATDPLLAPRAFMARKLKTYQTSLGFFDQAIAAPSMKAALQAWGTKTNLFHHGVAKEVDDPDIIAATMRKPGVILKRPIGSNGPFKEHAICPHTCLVLRTRADL